MNKQTISKIDDMNMNVCVCVDFVMATYKQTNKTRSRQNTKIFVL